MWSAHSLKLSLAFFYTYYIQCLSFILIICCLLDHEIVDIYGFCALKITGFTGWATAFPFLFADDKVFAVRCFMFCLYFLMIHCPVPFATIMYFLNWWPNCAHHLTCGINYFSSMFPGVSSMMCVTLSFCLLLDIFSTRRRSSPLGRSLLSWWLYLRWVNLICLCI